MSIGVGIGPLAGGYIFDVSGSYLWAMILAAALGAGALAIVLALPSKGDSSWQKAQEMLEQ